MRAFELAVPKPYAVAFGDIHLVAGGNSTQPRNYSGTTSYRGSGTKGIENKGLSF